MHLEKAVRIKPGLLIVQVYKFYAFIRKKLHHKSRFDLDTPRTDSSPEPWYKENAFEASYRDIKHCLQRVHSEAI